MWTGSSAVTEFGESHTARDCWIGARTSRPKTEAWGGRPPCGEAVSVHPIHRSRLSCLGSDRGTSRGRRRDRAFVTPCPMLTLGALQLRHTARRMWGLELERGYHQ